jgi:competence protein ComEA
LIVPDVKTAGVVTSLLASLLICSGLSTSRSVIVAAQADKLPEAPGKPVVVKACTSCHDTSIMTDAPRTIAGWIDVMYLMKDFGAVLTEAESQTVTDYLVTNLALVEMNKAEAGHLALVFGVTDTVAKEVVAFRDKQGGFKTIDDLKKAPGLDAAKIDALKDRLLFR